MANYLFDTFIGCSEVGFEISSCLVTRTVRLVLHSYTSFDHKITFEVLRHFSLEYFGKKIVKLTKLYSRKLVWGNFLLSRSHFLANRSMLLHQQRWCSQNRFDIDIFSGGFLANSRIIWPSMPMPFCPFGKNWVWIDFILLSTVFSFMSIGDAVSQSEDWKPTLEWFSNWC